MIVCNNSIGLFYIRVNLTKNGQIADIMITLFGNCKLSSSGIQIVRVHQINDTLSKLKSCIRIYSCFVSIPLLVNYKLPNLVQTTRFLDSLRKVLTN
jgi:hypothetical protein